MTSTGKPAASWYPDPLGRHEHRYWDGERWTVHVADQGVTGIDGATQPQPVVQQPVVQQPVVQQPVVQQPVVHQPVVQPSVVPAATARSGAARVWLVAIAFLVAIAGVGITAVLALGGDDEPETSLASDHRSYPALVETNFMNSCTATGGTADYCRCSLTQLEQTVDLDEFATIEQDYLRTGQLPASVTSAIRACLSQQVQP
jgi:hypothetical protein